MGKIEGAAWGYVQGKNGPEEWGTINPEWAVANTGEEQSPIDVSLKDAAAAPELGELVVQYAAAPAVASINQIGVLNVEWEPGVLIVEGKRFKAASFHFHTPSEHTVDGERFAAEMHIVHVAEEGQGLAVLGFLIDGPVGATPAGHSNEGEENPFLAGLIPSLPIKDASKGDKRIESLSPTPLFHATISKDYIRYNGSLTTPPCSEGVKWTLMLAPQRASASQLQAIRDSIRWNTEAGCPLGNARPVQPVFKRKVLRYCHPVKLQIQS